MQYQVKSHRTISGLEYEYITAHMPSNGRYRPGYVNEVMIYPQEDGSFRVEYTDGYKVQGLGHYPNKHAAMVAAIDALDNGAGGGFTSRFEPNGVMP